MLSANLSLGQFLGQSRKWEALVFNEKRGNARVLLPRCSPTEFYVIMSTVRDSGFFAEIQS
jgi:hypothetical protein